MSYVDLTAVIRDGMEVYPGDPAVKLERVAEIPKQVCRLSRLSMGSHTGTHMDAPAHFLREGAYLDELPVEQFMGRAMIFSGDTDFSQVKLSGLDFVILDFDWAKHRSGGDFYTEYPAITAKNASILSLAGLKGVGMDTPSADNRYTDTENHHILLSGGLILIEGLCNLERVGRGIPFDLTALPLRWKRSDGAPCRAVARMEENAEC